MAALLADAAQHCRLARPGGAALAPSSLAALAQRDLQLDSARLESKERYRGSLQVRCRGAARRPPACLQPLATPSRMPPVADSSCWPPASPLRAPLLQLPSGGAIAVKVSVKQVLGFDGSRESGRHQEVTVSCSELDAGLQAALGARRELGAAEASGLGAMVEALLGFVRSVRGG
jgi:hypothetical protein